MSEVINPYESPRVVQVSADEPLRTVRFAGRYSVKEALTAAAVTESHPPKVLRLLRFAYCLIPLVLMMLTTLLAEQSILSDFRNELGVASAMLLGIAVLLTGFEIIRERKRWRQQFAGQDAGSTGVFESFEGAISQDGLTIRKGSMSVMRPWSDFAYFRAVNDVLVFWNKVGYEADVLSRQQFESDKDWLLARRMAEHHLPKRLGGAIVRG